MRDFAVERGSATIRGSESGTGTPVVFVHAGVADRRSWFDVMTLLADRDCRCVAYDQRGYGDTTSTDAAYSPRDDLGAVLEDRTLEHVVLVGASRGGQIALDLALAMPDRVAGLMLIGSAPGDAPFPSPVQAVTELSAAIERAEEDGDLAEVNELEAQAWLDGPLAPPGRVGPPLRDLFLDMNGRALAATGSGAPTAFEPTWDRLPTLRLPASVLIGELDMPGLIAAATATAEALPDARLRRLANTAHLPMLEQPAVIADEVLALCARVAAR